MKRYWKGVLLSALITFTFCNYAGAQDKNLLAKLAYENAENALEAGNLAEGIQQLAKVDELLGKLTPKSQYLRLQLWASAAGAKASYHDSVINEGQKYLQLSKSFDIAEEKQLEVLRIVQKFEKEKSAAEARINAEAACREVLKKIEATAGTRDQSRIAAITGIDWDTDVFAQLKAANRVKNKTTRTAYTNYYHHQGSTYQVAGIMYSNVLGGYKTYRITGIDAQILDNHWSTTAGGAFHRLESFYYVVPRMAPGVEPAFSNILGFPPDARLEGGGHPVTWFWWFRDYTVSVADYPPSTAIPNHTIMISVTRHYPAGVTSLGKAAFIPCE